MFIHISPAYVTIHTPCFEDKIQKSVPPPTHLTPALPFLFCLSMKQLSGFSPELTGESKNQRPSDLDENTRILPLCVLFFNRSTFFPTKECHVNNQSGFVLSAAGKVSSPRSVSAVFLLRLSYLALSPCSMKCQRLGRNLCQLPLSKVTEGTK